MVILVLAKLSPSTNRYREAIVLYVECIILFISLSHSWVLWIIWPFADINSVVWHCDDIHELFPNHWKIQEFKCITRGPWAISLTWVTVSINKYICKSYDFSTITLTKEKKSCLLFETWMFLICKNLSPLHLRMLCVKFGWNWSISSDWEDFKFLQSIFTISLFSPL